jgi:rhodanese-related sulfurtransferase
MAWAINLARPLAMVKFRYFGISQIDNQLGNTDSTMDLFIQFLTQQWPLAGALAVVLFMLFRHEGKKSGPSLSPQQAIKMVNSNEGVFLDLRDGKDYQAGHIVEALHIPATKLESRMEELETYKQQPIILVCKMGQQASAAGKQLKANGYEQVYKMKGGMMEWTNLQLPTVK